MSNLPLPRSKLYMESLLEELTRKHRGETVKLMRLPCGVDVIYVFEWEIERDEDCRKHGHTVYLDKMARYDIGNTYCSDLSAAEVEKSLLTSVERKQKDDQRRALATLFKDGVVAPLPDTGNSRLTATEALVAIHAVMNGDWDNPYLERVGPLHANFVLQVRQIMGASEAYTGLVDYVHPAPVETTAPDVVHLVWLGDTDPHYPMFAGFPSDRAHTYGGREPGETGINSMAYYRQRPKGVAEPD